MKKSTIRSAHRSLLAAGLVTVLFSCLFSRMAGAGTQKRTGQTEYETEAISETVRDVSVTDSDGTEIRPDTAISCASDTSEEQSSELRSGNEMMDASGGTAGTDETQPAEEIREAAENSGRETAGTDSADENSAGSVPASGRQEWPEEKSPEDRAGSDERETSDKQTDCPDPSPETGNTEEQEKDTDPSGPEDLPEGKRNWVLVLSDIRPAVPEGGRVYDGTDRIDVVFSWHLERRGEERSGSGEDQEAAGQTAPAGKENEGNTVAADTKGTGGNQDSDRQRADAEDGGASDACDRKEDGQNKEDRVTDEQKAGGKAGKDESAPPQVEVTCSSHLDCPDAGERKVLYGFSFEIKGEDQKSNVIQAVEDPHPELTVKVEKRLLTVVIPNGRKVYGEKVSMKNIWPEDTSEEVMNGTAAYSRNTAVPAGKRLKAKVTGFLPEPDGTIKTPDGFQAPEVAVNTKVLQTYSPMFREGEKAVYKQALVMKRREDGTLTGNPTGNYRFCEDPKDPHYICGNVEIAARKVRRGRDYSVRGGQLLDEGGCLIVRSGSSLSVVPDGDKGFDTGYQTGKIRSDCTVSFRLKKKGKNGELLAESLPESILCRADGSVPPAKMRVTGAHERGGILFTGSDCTVKIVPQADSVSGLLEVRYRIWNGQGRNGADVHPAGEWESVDPSVPSTITLDKDGVWQVETAAADRAGNTAGSFSPMIVVDHEDPDCRISGVTDQSANSGEARLVITFSDRWIEPGTAKVQIRSPFGGTVPQEEFREETDQTVVIRMKDFERTRKADAWYYVRAEAADKSGNRVVRELSFSVNRFGSAYGLDAETEKQLGTLFHKTPFDVTFLETNLSEVADSKILVMRDGRRQKNIRARVEKDTPESEDGGEKGLNHYRYILPADSFTKSGQYEVILMTSDRAGNASDSQLQNLPVRFIIDSEKPQCFATGIGKRGVYRTDRLTAVFEVRDNIGVKSAEISLDGRSLSKYSSGDIQKAGGVLKVSLRGKEVWQYLKIRVTDKAGNELKETYPVYLSSDGTKPPPEEGTEKSGKETRTGLLSGARQAAGTGTDTQSADGKRAGKETGVPAGQAADTAFQRRDSFQNRKEEAVMLSEGEETGGSESAEWDIRTVLLISPVIPLFLVSVCIFRRRKERKKKQISV